VGLKILFWAALLTLVYTYLGYGLLLWAMVKVKSFFSQKNHSSPRAQQKLPTLGVLIAAYNEMECIAEKVANCRELDYPSDLLKIWFVTDGSDDGTPELLAELCQNLPFPIQIEHQSERKGKTAAIERIMPLVDSEIVVFSDANTLLNREALLILARSFQNPKVGVAAGEKRILQNQKDQASAAGEGLYWRYESWLKSLDAQLYTCVGAAGELFAIRRSLFQNIPGDILTEDFYLSLRIAGRGYRIAYLPDAYAMEQASASVAEEMKRKVRIAAGGLQCIWRLKDLLLPWRHGWLSWQFFSHKVLRLGVAPWLLPLIFVLNVVLAQKMSGLYLYMCIGQVFFYTLAALGYFLQGRSLSFKVLFVPYYFWLMNWGVYRGLFRLLRGRDTVLWEKAKRR
jgi:poly-beta-1,6-N-acetyl-D-glucosamine synthase